MTVDCKSITIINGWAAQNSVWDDFVALLNSHYQVTIIALPRGEKGVASAGLNVDFQLDDLVALLDRRINGLTHLVAWSLGGNVALQFANQHSDKVASLITIATTPKFIQGADWDHGMASGTFAEFYQSLLSDEIKALKLFAGLQAMGDKQEKKVLKVLRQSIDSKDELDQHVLAAGLDILASVDQRDLWLNPHQKVKHLFGENDNLVDASLAKFGSSGTVMPGVSHVPMLSAAAELALIVEEFIA